MNEIERHRMDGFINRIFILGIFLVLGIDLLIIENIPHLFRILFIDVFVLGWLMLMVFDMQEAEASE